jgi:hypothetical protein
MHLSNQHVKFSTVFLREVIIKNNERANFPQNILRSSNSEIDDFFGEAQVINPKS